MTTLRTVVGAAGTVLNKGCGLIPLVLAAVSVAGLAADTAEDDAADQQSAEQPRYVRKEFHDPDGIGKFYMGREIAKVMGFGGIDWLERPKREQEEKLTLLVKSLKLKPGMVVADIGAGSGRISLMIAEQVGQTGKVLAVDVQQEMLEHLAAKLKRLEVTNVQLVKGDRKSPRLKVATVDLVVMVDVYHEFEFPYEMMRELSASLKPGGRVAFVEYRKEDPTVQIKLVHKMSQAQVKKEMAQAEFSLKWVETIDVLPLQHLIIFERLAKTDGDSPAERRGSAAVK